MRELNETIQAIRSGRFKVDQPENSILRLEARLRELERMRQRGHQGVTVPVEVTFSLGSAYFRAGRLTDAEREWTAAVSADEAFGEAWNNLAALYLMTGRPTLAGEAVGRAERAGFPVNPNLKADIRRAGGG
jgi:tetratricopeptide (TPR) repeat protein